MRVENLIEKLGECGVTLYGDELKVRGEGTVRDVGEVADEERL